MSDKARKDCFDFMYLEKELFFRYNIPILILTLCAGFFQNLTGVSFFKNKHSCVESILVGLYSMWLKRIDSHPFSIPPSINNQTSGSNSTRVGSFSRGKVNVYSPESTFIVSIIKGESLPIWMPMSKGKTKGFPF